MKFHYDEDREAMQELQDEIDESVKKMYTIVSKTKDRKLMLKFMDALKHYSEASKIIDDM